MAAPKAAAPAVVVQISDPHIGADWGEGDPIAMLSALVDSTRALNANIVGVLVSGDLADHATDDEYDRVRELLEPLEAPVCVLPGNHDDRAALCRHFGVPGAGGEPVQYATDFGPLRVVALDSTRPGEDHGELDTARLSWLDDTLRSAPTTPTLLAMHHTPLRTGVPVIDEVGLAESDRHALGALIERHPQVLRIVGGVPRRAGVSDAEPGCRPLTRARFAVLPGVVATPLRNSPSRRAAPSARPPTVPASRASRAQPRLS